MFNFEWFLYEIMQIYSDNPIFLSEYYYDNEINMEYDKIRTAEPVYSLYFDEYCQCL